MSKKTIIFNVVIMTLGFQQKNAINLSSILAKWCLNDAMRL